MEFEYRNPMIEPPMLHNGDNFSIWKKRMIAFFNFSNSYFLESIKKGPHIPPTEKSKWSDEDKLKVRLDFKAMHTLTLSLPNDIFTFVKHSESAKEMWDNLILHFEGTGKPREKLLMNEYRAFTYKNGESVTETYIRFNRLINELKEHNRTFDNEDMMIRFLRSVNPALNHVRHVENLENMSLQSLYGSLLADELKLNTIV